MNVAAILRGFAARILSLRGAIGGMLYGTSGAFTLGAAQQLAQTCRGGACVNCGGCAVTFGAAAVAAIAGASLRRGRRRPAPAPDDCA